MIARKFSILAFTCVEFRADAIGFLGDVRKAVDAQVDPRQARSWTRRSISVGRELGRIGRHEGVVTAAVGIGDHVRQRLVHRRLAGEIEIDRRLLRLRHEIVDDLPEDLHRHQAARPVHREGHRADGAAQIAGIGDVDDDDRRQLLEEAQRRVARGKEEGLAPELRAARAFRSGRRGTSAAPSARRTGCRWQQDRSPRIPFDASALDAEHALARNLAANAGRWQRPHATGPHGCNARLRTGTVPEPASADGALPCGLAIAEDVQDDRLVATTDMQLLAAETRQIEARFLRRLGRDEAVGEVVLRRGLEPAGDGHGLAERGDEEAALLVAELGDDRRPGVHADADAQRESAALRRTRR